VVVPGFELEETVVPLEIQEEDLEEAVTHCRCSVKLCSATTHALNLHCT